MPIVDIAIRIALYVAVAMGWWLTRLSPQHRPAARALSALLVHDAVYNLSIRTSAPSLLRAALFLISYTVQIALALRVFARVPPAIEQAPGALARRVSRALRAAVPVAPWIPWAGWLIAVIILALRWDLAVVVYRVTFLATLAVLVVASALFVLRRPRELPGPAQGVAMALALSAIADLAGPWRRGAPRQDWDSGALVALFTWSAVSAWEGWRCLQVYCRQRSS